MRIKIESFLAEYLAENGKQNSSHLSKDKYN